MAGAAWGCGAVVALVAFGAFGVFWQTLGMPGPVWVWSTLSTLWLLGAFLLMGRIPGWAYLALLSLPLVGIVASVLRAAYF